MTQKLNNARLFRACKKMVRCTSKTVSGKRCKLHRVFGFDTCTIHSPMAAVDSIENVIVENTIIENTVPLDKNPPQPPVYIQTQAELLVEKKIQQQIWKGLKEPNDQISNLIVSIHETPTNDLLPCGHSCVGILDKCCGCADTRPLDTKYMRHVEGVGELNVGLREDDYCVTCKGYWVTGMPLMERYDCIMNTNVCAKAAPALGAYGLEFCAEVKDTISWLVHMHNAMYSRSVELTLMEETSSTDVNVN